MAKQFLGTMGVIFPIESINRKLALRREKSGTKTVAGKVIGGHQFMGGFTRTYGVVTGNDKREAVKVQYSFVRKFGRTSKLSVKEVAQRQRFQVLVAAVRSIMEDLSQITNVQMLYLQAVKDVSKKINGVSALGTSTIRGWIWKVQYWGMVHAEEEGQEYDATTFPTKFDA